MERKKIMGLGLQSVVNSRERAFKPGKTVICVSGFNKDWAGIDSILYVCLAMNMTNVS
jgi:NADPH-dependent curcumin reductase CurA